MPSQALHEWRTTQRADLDRLFAAARAADPALRQQLIDACLVLLAGHFQLFCRSLHAEASDLLAAQIQPLQAQRIVKDLLTAGRRLDRGNAHPAAIGEDFARLDMNVGRLFLPDPQRRRRLEQLNTWRNAIAHQDLSSRTLAAAVAGSARTLPWVKTWRADCSALARALDREVCSRLNGLLGTRPW